MKLCYGGYSNNLAENLPHDQDVVGSMGSCHRQVEILVPDDKLDCFGYSGKNWLGPKQSSFSSGTSTAT